MISCSLNFTPTFTITPYSSMYHEKLSSAIAGHVYSIAEKTLPDEPLIFLEHPRELSNNPSLMTYRERVRLGKKKFADSL